MLQLWDKTSTLTLYRSEETVEVGCIVNNKQYLAHKPKDTHQSRNGSEQFNITLFFFHTSHVFIWTVSKIKTLLKCTTLRTELQLVL